MLIAGVQASPLWSLGFLNFATTGLLLRTDVHAFARSDTTCNKGKLHPRCRCRPASTGPDRQGLTGQFRRSRRCAVTATGCFILPWIAMSAGTGSIMNDPDGPALVVRDLVSLSCASYSWPLHNGYAHVLASLDDTGCIILLPFRTSMHG